MLGLILRTVITGLGIWLAAYFVPGVSANSTSALVWAAIALGLITAFVRPILVLLTRPFTILTLGLFLLLVFLRIFFSEHSSSGVGFEFLGNFEPNCLI